MTYKEWELKVYEPQGQPRMTLQEIEDYSAKCERQIKADYTPEELREWLSALKEDFPTRS